MAFLHSKEESVERLSGLSLKGTMLTTTQYHDRRHVLPFVLEKGGKSYFLVREMDSGNVQGAGFNALPQVHFMPYFLPGVKSEIPGNMAKVVLSMLGKEPLVVDVEMPVSVYRELKASADVSIEKLPTKPVEAFRMTAKQVLSKFNHHRADVVRAANEITAGHPQYKRLNALYNQKGDPFGILDAKGKAAGIGAFLGTWVTDFQELSGLKGTLSECCGYAALYLAEKAETWIIVPAGDAKGYSSSFRSFGSFAEAVRELSAGAVVGIEEDTLGAERFETMARQGVAMKDAGAMLKEWRDEKVKFDVPYFVLAAMATRYAMEGAYDFADLAIRANVAVTEREVDSVYRSRLDEFAKKYKLQVELKFFFVNTHAGSRTIFPSRPTDYVIHKGINSLKLDSGIFVFDDGLFHASSDIARTVTTTEAADEVADIMERVLVEQTIPGIKPGMTGDEIHRMGVNQMAEQAEVFQRNGYMPSSFSWRDGYPRDIGHSMDRQETTHFHFKPGAALKVLSGMVGCIEYHCAYDNHAIAAEDTFVLDDQGAIIISRGAEEFGPDGKVTKRRRLTRI